MPDVGFANLVAVCLIAFGGPLLLGLAPAIRIPAVVLEIVAGIAVGPSGLDLVRVDLPVEVLSILGLAFLLFLAGLEVDPKSLRVPLVREASIGFAITLVLAAAVGFGLSAAGLVDAPLLVAVILSATGLGVVVPVLKDAGQTGSTFGQLVVVASSIADFGAVILLTILFSREATTPGARVLLLAGLVVLGVLTGLAIARAGRVMRLSAVLERLQDTTAQIRVRGTVLLLVAFVAVAERLGLEAILGAFLAGAVISVVDVDRAMTHEHFRVKLQAIGFGFLVPVFFVTSGLRFDLEALYSDASTLLLVPLFALALLVVRGVPALRYRASFGTRRSIAAALFQATSLSFVVAASGIGVELGVLDPATSAALVSGGLVSVLAFPAAGLALLRREQDPFTEPLATP